MREPFEFQCMFTRQGFSAEVAACIFIGFARCQETLELLEGGESEACCHPVCI